jgi:hypothetical protein
LSSNILRLFDCGAGEALVTVGRWDGSIVQLGINPYNGSLVSMWGVLVKQLLKVTFGFAMLMTGGLPGWADIGPDLNPDLEVDPGVRQYTFAWPFSDDSEMRPRGGITRGQQIELDLSPSKAWRALSQPGLSAFERDRHAILAMAGPYRTSFDFIETVNFSAPFLPTRPYQSWATEYVYVVEDSGRLISLQHILVMFFGGEEGAVSEPMVVKHWRQDWQYEDRDLHVYRGHRRWQRQRLSPKEVAGTWSQTVYQVDDSPRYEAIGSWVHHAGYSSWQSGQTWRPLPRREFSVRDDYHVLAGTNRHTITPTGWVQEEDNLKIVLAEDDSLSPQQPVLAREVGLNRYERIKGHDFAAGDAYWQRTGPFWRDVRLAWSAYYRDHEAFTLRDRVDDRGLFEHMFGYADGIESAASYDAGAGRRFIDQTLSKFVY